MSTNVFQVNKISFISDRLPHLLSCKVLRQIEFGDFKDCDMEAFQTNINRKG